MEVFQDLAGGFATAMTPENLFFCFVGAVVGTLVGVLPGIGPTAAMGMLLPLTFQLPPAGAIIMLAAIFYGSQYGGTITTILLNVPGEGATVPIQEDGHSMARAGRAGIALSIAAVASFIGGTVATIGLVIAAGPVSEFALKFGPPEYAAFVLLALALVMVLGGSSLAKSLLMAAFGMLLATIGLDPVTGTQRFTFGVPEVFDGLELVPLIMGLFGISEVLQSLEVPAKEYVLARTASFVPTRQDVREATPATLRGTALGFIFGLFPGFNSTLTAFTSYIAEKRLSPNKEKFGHGAIEGLAGPSAADNAHANAAFIPMFTLGIPGSPGIAVLMSAFIINGLTPGPLLFAQHSEIAWAIIASFYLGNVMLLVLNLPLIPLWVRFLRIPFGIQAVFILLFTVVGAYSLNGSMFDVWLMLAFGVLGYGFKKLDLPAAPLVLAFILGPILEATVYQSMGMFQGNLLRFVERPLVAVSLTVLGFLFLWSIARHVRRAASRAVGPEPLYEVQMGD